eukprot:jgi/Chrzof1/11626/Cz06g02220.t1
MSVTEQASQDAGPFKVVYFKPLYVFPGWFDEVEGCCVHTQHSDYDLSSDELPSIRVVVAPDVHPEQTIVDITCPIDPQVLKVSAI